MNLRYLLRHLLNRVKFLNKEKPVTYFPPNETRCKCGCGFDITPEARGRFDALRTAFGMPLTVSGGARCADYNKVKDGAEYSRHIYGDALDFAVPTEYRWKLVYHAMNLGFKGIGINKRFIHIDCRPDKNGAIWEY